MDDINNSWYTAFQTRWRTRRNQMMYFSKTGRVHLKRRGSQLSPLLAVEGCGSVGSNCITFSKYRDHRLKISLQRGKKLVKRSGEHEVVYNVYKFMKTESEVGIKIPLSKVQKTVAEATRVRRTLCRVLNEGENVETCHNGIFNSAQTHT